MATPPATSMSSVRTLNRASGSVTSSSMAHWSWTWVRTAGRSSLSSLAAVGAGERQGLQEALALTDRRCPDAPDRRGDCPLRPHLGGRGDDELGHVLGQAGVGDGELAEAEVDHPGLAVVVQEHVGQAKVPVRDALVAQQRHLGPDAVEHLVGDRLVRLAVERLPVDGLVGQQHPVGADGGDAAQPRCADAAVAGLEGNERLVLHGPSQRAERPLVADVLEGEPPDDPEHEVRAALVATEGLDEQLLAVGRSGEPRG
jgi:hypothetical protein